MVATKFIVLALLFVGCSYASPLKVATIYGSPLFAIFVQDLDEPRAGMDEESVRALNDDTVNVAARDADTLVEKRSAERADDDDLETAAGTNVLRPLFVYRQQIAYRERAREAIRRGRRI